MIAGLVHRAWGWAARAGARRFRDGLQDPIHAQSARLSGILRRAQGSAFANDHGLRAETALDDFRTRVPLRTWDEMSGWMEKVQAGRLGILTGDPVQRLVPTSGSSQACKLIPTGRALVAEFRAALDPWLTGMLQDHPDIADGCGYWAISPPCAFARDVRAGFPVGFEDDTAYFGPLAKLVSKVQAVPPSVAWEPTAQAFRQATMAHLLQRADLRFVSIWHPSFFELLLDHMEKDWDALLRGIAGIDAARARELGACGPRPERIWPRLKVVSAWGDATAEGPARALMRRLPDIAFIPKGLVATEGITSIPWRGRRPLAITSHFLEFLDEAGEARGAAELRAGRAYEVVLTTSGGLWRLRTGDRVEVDGCVEATPSIRFLGRQGGVVDLRGEKLNEIHVTRCLQSLDGLVRPGDWRMLTPSGDGAGYLLLLDKPQAEKRAITERLERGLRENPHYALARDLGQLRALEIETVPEGAGVRVLARMVALGMAHGAAKPPLLDPRADWHASLRNPPREDG
jgi:hypothetical protein